MKIKFVIVSKDDNFEMRSDSFGGIDGVSVDLVGYNSAALGEVYNRYLDNPAVADNDYVFFMHSDVKFDVASFVEQLRGIDGKYDLIGLCGTSKLVVSVCPLNWFCGSNPCPEHRWGCVTHGELSNQRTFFSRHHPDISDHEASCIDGLCIGFSKKAVASGMRFDQTVGKFDCYDTDISLQAVIKYRLKVGVMVRTDLQHYSVGKSILAEDFLKNEYALRKKWNIPIPDKIKALGFA